jgi:hypothetical protein
MSLSTIQALKALPRKRNSALNLLLRYDVAGNNTSTQRSSYEVPDMFVLFEPRLNFLEIFSHNSPISGIPKIHPVKAALIYADGPTDKTKLIADFSDYAKKLRKPKR